jgi:glyoxalase family protein
MKLDGIHHITAITGDAPTNVRFYAGTLGLRLVKKTVNQDDPTVYHLFYGDDEGSPGMDLTFFEYPGARPGRAGDGMVYRVVWRAGSVESLDFWAGRLGAEGVEVLRVDRESLRFADPEGLEHELVVDDSGETPLRAAAPDIPAEHALRGFSGVRAYASDPEESAGLLGDTLGFEGAGAVGEWRVAGDQRSSTLAYDPPPDGHGIPGAGTVHHVAFATRIEDQDAWRLRVAQSGARPTPVIDRFYFRSIYFREPSGVLFELATMGPGFAVDEPAEHLGERLSLPPAFEQYRAQVERSLTPLPDVRAERESASAS